MGMSKEEFMNRYTSDMKKKKLAAKEREQDIRNYEIARNNKLRKIYG